METMKHPVYDTDTHFVIDPITREMSNTACRKACLIQHDHNSERFTFEAPLYVEGHEMLKCDSVQIHYINIDSQTKEQSAGVYEVTDVDTIPDLDRPGICFSWLISHNATEYVGSLSFLVRFACYGEDGNLSYVWNTAIYSGISISNGIDNGEAIIDDYADILNEWKNETLAFRLVDLMQIVTSTASEGENVWRATFADGETRELRVRNGAKGEKGDMPDMSDYVQKTDVAQHKGEPGLVKLAGAGTYGITLRGGVLAISGARASELEALESDNYPITPKNLTYAFKIGLLANATGGVPATENATELTAAEQTAITAWLGMNRTQLASYVGTGTFGADNPCSLTFDFAPKVVIYVGRIVSHSNSQVGYESDAFNANAHFYNVIFCDGLNEEYVQYCGFFERFAKLNGGYDEYRYAKKSTDGMTIYWYTSLSNADIQLNTAGDTYHFIAIG